MIATTRALHLNHIMFLNWIDFGRPFIAAQMALTVSSFEKHATWHEWHLFWNNATAGADCIKSHFVMLSPLGMRSISSRIAHLNSRHAEPNSSHAPHDDCLQGTSGRFALNVSASNMVFSTDLRCQRWFIRAMSDAPERLSKAGRCFLSLKSSASVYRAASRHSSVQPCRQLIEYTSNDLRRNRRLVIEAWTREMTPGISYFSAANSNADRSSMVARAQPTSISTQQTMRNLVPTTRVGSSN